MSNFAARNPMGVYHYWLDTPAYRVLGKPLKKQD